MSYSRKDAAVIENYRQAQIALGIEIFIDAYSIKAGDDWKLALTHAIDKADVFQLFWSKNSAESANVKNEWDYALRFRCAETKCVEFIRPIYWTEPMPTPPKELADLNFRRVTLSFVEPVVMRLIRWIWGKFRKHQS